jgi:hypothetical protein
VPIISRPNLRTALHADAIRPGGLRVDRYYFVSVWLDGGQIHYACPQASDLHRIRQGGKVVSRLVLVLAAFVAGAVLAVGATFTVTSVLAGSNESPVNQQLYNYGGR